MAGRDPRWDAGMRGSRGRMDRPPGWAESLFAGRSRAEKEADQDAQMKMIGAIVAVVVAIGVGLYALFTAAGLQFGWWVLPVFAPWFGWLLVSMACKRVLRPVELDGLRWPRRLQGAGALAVALWVVWPLWSGPAAAAWKAGHGRIGTFGLRYPLGAVLGASPVAMGLVAFLLVAFWMVLGPRLDRREREYQGPPAGPEPLRSRLLFDLSPPPGDPPEPPRGGWMQ